MVCIKKQPYDSSKNEGVQQQYRFSRLCQTEKKIQSRNHFYLASYEKWNFVLKLF